MNDMELYSRYFPVGKKVGVGIPMPNADVFKDWAIIHEIEEDLVSLQLSRDVLPAEVTLHYGQILELRGGTEESGYCCRAIVVSEGDARVLLLRLIGEIVSDELREFYRIDAFLPIRYFVSSEQNIDRLHKQWEERRDQRREREFEEKDKHWKSDDSGEGKVNNTQESWDATIPLAANISGGGLRIITHQGFDDGEYLLLEIMVPSPRRVVDVVGRIVFANRNFAAGSDQEYFNTGVQFVYIDDRDRDAVVTYISTIQLKRIRQLRERYLYRGSLVGAEQSDSGGSKNIRKIVVQMVAVLFFAILLAFTINYFWYYATEHPKGEIQRTFEEGVIKYRKQLKQ